MKLPSPPTVTYATDHRSTSKTAEFNLMQFCVVCTGHYFVRERDEGKILTCCKRCDRRYHRAKVAEERTYAIESLAKAEPLTPADAGRLRSQVFGMMAEQIEVAHAFVMQRPVDPTDPSSVPKWNPQQVKVFTSLLDKVVPNLSHTFIDQSGHGKSMAEMSREELEALVASAKIIEGEAVPAKAGPDRTTHEPEGA